MKNNKHPNNRRIISVGQIAGWIAVFVLAVVLFNRPGAKQSTLDYSDFKQKVASAEVSDLTVAPEIISGLYKDDKGQFVPFKTVRMADPDLVKELSAAKIKYKATIVEPKDETMKGQAAPVRSNDKEGKKDK